MNTLAKVLVVGVGGGAGFFIGTRVGAIGGPVGLAIGAGIGLIIDAVASSSAPAAAAATPGVPAGVVLPASMTTPGAPAPSAFTPASVAALPAGANVQAGINATHMMLLGQPAEKVPAASYLKQFQTSVGLPATGKLDLQTRTLLIAATAGSPYKASNLPAITILG